LDRGNKKIQKERMWSNFPLLIEVSMLCDTMFIFFTPANKLVYICVDLPVSSLLFRDIYWYPWKTMPKKIKQE